MSCCSIPSLLHEMKNYCTYGDGNAFALSNPNPNLQTPQARDLFFHHSCSTIFLWEMIAGNSSFVRSFVCRKWVAIGACSPLEFLAKSPRSSNETTAVLSFSLRRRSDKRNWFFCGNARCPQQSKMWREDRAVSKIPFWWNWLFVSVSFVLVRVMEVAEMLPRIGFSGRHSCTVCVAGRFVSESFFVWRDLAIGDFFVLVGGQEYLRNNRDYTCLLDEDEAARQEQQQERRRNSTSGSKRETSKASADVSLERLEYLDRRQRLKELERQKLKGKSGSRPLLHHDVPETLPTAQDPDKRLHSKNHRLASLKEQAF